MNEWMNRGMNSLTNKKRNETKWMNERIGGWT